MTELKVYLSEELDKRFRMLAMRVYGYGRGSLSEAAVEALTKWCMEHETTHSAPELSERPSSSSSDPITRAEERPGIVSSEKGENSSSAHPLS